MIKNSLTFSSAYLLVSHGSRDPRPQIAELRLAQLVRQQLIHAYREPFRRGFRIDEELAGATAVMSRTQDLLVGTASLELAPVPLHESIQQFARRAQAAGLKRLQVLPLFLLPGVHVTEDIPTEVALAQQALEEKVVIELQPHLGSRAGIRNLLAEQLSHIPASARLLLSHGSRRAIANRQIDVIASELGAVAAYWSVSPSLAEQVEALFAAGHRQIGILPYFLFAGGITEAITQRVEQLRLAFPSVQLLLGEPLGATAQLANLIVEGIAR